VRSLQQGSPPHPHPEEPRLATNPLWRTSQAQLPQPRRPPQARHVLLPPRRRPRPRLGHLSGQPPPRHPRPTFCQRPQVQLSSHQLPSWCAHAVTCLPRLPTPRRHLFPARRRQTPQRRRPKSVPSAPQTTQAASAPGELVIRRPLGRASLQREVHPAWTRRMEGRSRHRSPTCPHREAAGRGGEQELVYRSRRNLREVNPPACVFCSGIVGVWSVSSTHRGQC
jgi:hypothetical protein